MPRSITQYRVFIASPGGLDEERRAFRKTLESYTACDAEPRGITFHPVGWEDTLGGVGRPQELINEDLKQCDYAIFVLHDRWGSPTGSGHSSGVAEEWKLAQELYAATTIRNIGLYFKQVDGRQLKDPGEQLKKVLDFKAGIASAKKHFCRDYAALDEFCEHLRRQLAKWLRDHEGKASGGALAGLESASLSSPGKAEAAPPAAPAFDYWIGFAERLLEVEPAETRDYHGAAFCADQALSAAGSDLEWAQAKNLWGRAKLHLNETSAAFAAFTGIAGRLDDAGDPERRFWAAKALYNKGATLGTLGRNEEAIAVCDDVVARYGAATEVTLRELVAAVLLNKGVTLRKLKRGAEAKTVFADLIARFGTATEPALKDIVDDGRKFAS